jgi:hypothetical protein
MIQTYYSPGSSEDAAHAATLAAIVQSISFP